MCQRRKCFSFCLQQWRQKIESKQKVLPSLIGIQVVYVLLRKDCHLKVAKSQNLVSVLSHLPKNELVPVNFFVYMANVHLDHCFENLFFIEKNLWDLAAFKLRQGCNAKGQQTFRASLFCWGLNCIAHINQRKFIFCRKRNCCVKVNLHHCVGLCQSCHFLNYQSNIQIFWGFSLLEFFALHTQS